MTTLRADEISPSLLLLDPNNYRFIDADGFIYAAEERFHEDNVQSIAFERLKKKESLLPLKSSLLQSGFIPIERIVVRPYQFAEQELYIVIEGNRRLAAVKWILNDHAAGANVPEHILVSITNLPVIVVEEEEPDDAFRASLMGIRHVSGIKQWGGYQRSKLVVTMRDDLGLEAPEVAGRLAMRTQEVNRRYRAYRALQQMQEDEEYGGYADSSMYPLFHEALALPIVREWLEWNEETNQFENPDTLNQFYDLITPHTDDDGNELSAKINTFAQVRALRSILPKPESRRVLFDPSHSFQDAVSIAKQEEFAREWVADILSAIRAMEMLSVEKLKNLDEDGIALITRLSEVVNERLQDHRTLVQQ